MTNIDFPVIKRETLVAKIDLYHDVHKVLPE
jgi:hypothetical protein